ELSPLEELPSTEAPASGLALSLEETESAVGSPAASPQAISAHIDISRIRRRPAVEGGARRRGHEAGAWGRMRGIPGAAGERASRCGTRGLIALASQEPSYPEAVGGPDGRAIRAIRSIRRPRAPLATSKPRIWRESS